MQCTWCGFPCILNFFLVLSVDFFSLNFLLYISGSHFSFGFSKVENWEFRFLEWVLKWREWPCSVTSCFCVLLCQPLSRCVLLLHANSDNLGVFHSYLLATTYKCFLNHVIETLLLLVDSVIMLLQFSYGEFKFLFCCFIISLFFVMHRLLRITKRRVKEKMAGMTKNQPSNWWWLDSHTTTKRSPWLQSTLSGMHFLLLPSSLSIFATRVSCFFAPQNFGHTHTRCI